MEPLVILLFSAGLLLCIISGHSILYALLWGYLLFFCYGLWKKHASKDLLLMSWRGVRTVRNILIVFALIGMITAAWRASGTIAFIIYSSAQLIVPSAFILITFLLNCLISLLTGTAFGTAATIGVICMSIGNVMGVNEIYMGGAVLSGAFFGDRCSPMSTSALLVSTLTQTNIFQNIRLMLKTGLVPFIITCILYWAAGQSGTTQTPSLEVLDIFAEQFSLHWVTLLPALLIILLSLFKINVKWVMCASIITAGIICLTLQDIAFDELLRILATGYQAKDSQLALMLNGGGAVSMLRVAAIVCISSSYFGLFDGTGLLDGLKSSIGKLSQKLTPFSSTLVVSLASGMVACNQTLAIMLTYQLCKDTFSDRQDLAITLEDTAVVTAPLIPWSIASAVPLTAVGAPATAILLACYLYLLPLWRIVKIILSGKQRRGQGIA